MKVAVYIIDKNEEYPVAICDDFKAAIDYKDSLKTKHPSHNFYHRQNPYIKDSMIYDLDLAKRLLEKKL